MMEVKHNTPMEFNDLVTSTNKLSSSISSLADVQESAIEDIKMNKMQQILPNLKKAPLNEVVEKKAKRSESITNGSTTISGKVVGTAVLKTSVVQSSTIDLEDVELDMATGITPELEDELLAEDEPDVVDKLIAAVVPTIPTDDDAEAEADSKKVKDSLAKTTAQPSANNNAALQRDPGDDLDTLLSKINDIVEDCSDATAAQQSKTIAVEEREAVGSVKAERIDKPAESNDLTMDDSIIILDDSGNDEELLESEVKTAEEEKTVATAHESTEAVAVEEKSAEQLKLEEKEKASDDKMETMEQDEVISVSDKMSLDVDMDGDNEKDLAKTADDDEKETNSSVKSGRESEKIGKNLNEKLESDKNAEAVDLEAEAEEISSKEVKSSSEEEKNYRDKEGRGSEAEIKEGEKPDPKEGVTALISEPDETKKSEKELETTKEDASAAELNPPDSDDDDVVFCCERTQEENDADNKKPEDTHENLKQVEKETKDAEKIAQENGDDDDDDVVLLDDDDDDVEYTAPIVEKIKEEKVVETQPKTTNKEEKSIEEAPTDEAAESKAAEEDKEIAASDKVVADSTDNARDKFSEADEPETVIAEISEQPQKSDDAEESNSNCSSSSNLLEVSQAVANSECCEEETEMGNDDEDDGGDNDCEAVGDVEILEADVGDEESKEGGSGETSEDKEEPPAKRRRVSEEDEENSKMSGVEEGGTTQDVKTTTKLEAATEATTFAEEEDVKDKIIKSDDEKISIKRAHDASLDASAEIKQESDIKKLKIEGSSLTSVDDERKSADTTATDSKSDIIEIKDLKEDADEDMQKATQTITTAAATTTTTIGEKQEPKVEEEEKLELRKIKAEPSHIPVQLYPPPVFEDPAPKLSYDFLKRFKKTLDKLTKADLEELVMQKIAEAIIHKSEFGEMREVIEKQEKTIATHRTKLTELSKQFRDLEMVHNRVLKDIETKNSQFLMPVKITRAVGLQVFIPLKKNTDPATNAAANTVTVNSSTATSQRESSSSGHYSRSTANSANAQTPQSQLTSPLRPGSNMDNSATPSAAAVSSLQQRSSSMLSSGGSTGSTSSRRGCMQKTTPQRPLESASMNAGQMSASAAYRSAQMAPHGSISPQIPAKLLNKSASAASSASAIAQMRNRYSGGGVSGGVSSSTTALQQQQQQQQQQGARQQPSPTNNARKLPTASPLAPPTKQPMPGSLNQQYRRIEPAAQMPTGSAVVDNYVSSMHQQTAGLPAVSITPAKPKDKSVIDLTDEDDAPNGAAAVAAAATAAATPMQTPTSTPTPTPTALQRQRSGNLNTSGGSANNTPSNYILNKVAASNARGSPLNANSASKTAARQQMSNLYGSKSNGNTPVPTNISTPPGTSITRIQVNSPLQRAKYGHPAPLPPTPAQNLHPAWKLPPPRPTIRISNLDNGIVISWTVEESMDRHAECVSYQIYAYQETSGPPLIDSWRHVGDVKAMLLPMAVTLTQFQEGQRYFFAVRAVDVHHRVGPFSVPKTWS